MIRTVLWALVAVVVFLLAGSSAAGAVGRGPEAPGAWPIDAPHPVVQGFRAPLTPFAAGHRGIDIAAPVGSPVGVMADGVVSWAGVVVDRPVVSVRHSGGFVSSYEPVTPSVAVGQPVAAGSVIGTLATGEHCAASCLHLGLRRDGQYVSPLLLLGGLSPPVLLPDR